MAGDPVRAFVPKPLPPEPPLVFDDDLFDLLGRANLALGRLDGLTAVLLDDVQEVSKLLNEGMEPPR